MSRHFIRVSGVTWSFFHPARTAPGGGRCRNQHRGGFWQTISTVRSRTCRNASGIAGFELSSDNHTLVGQQRLAGDPGRWIMAQKFIENRNRDSVSELIRVVLGDRLQGEETIANSPYFSCASEELISLAKIRSPPLNGGSRRIVGELKWPARYFVPLKSEFSAGASGTNTDENLVSACNRCKLAVQSKHSTRLSGRFTAGSIEVALGVMLRQ